MTPAIRNQLAIATNHIRRFRRRDYLEQANFNAAVSAQLAEAGLDPEEAAIRRYGEAVRAHRQRHGEQASRGGWR